MWSLGGHLHRDVVAYKSLEQYCVNITPHGLAYGNFSHLDRQGTVYVHFFFKFLKCFIHVKSQSGTSHWENFRLLSYPGMRQCYTMYRCQIVVCGR